VNRMGSICLAALTFTALAIILVNEYAAPNDYTEPVLQIPMLVFLALWGVGFIIFALSEEREVRGHWLPLITVVVIVAAFFLGTLHTD
jgi:hypothetical protein